MSWDMPKFPDPPAPPIWPRFEAVLVMVSGSGHIAVERFGGFHSEAEAWALGESMAKPLSKLLSVAVTVHETPAMRFQERPRD